MFPAAFRACSVVSFAVKPALVRLLLKIEMDFHSLANGAAVLVLMDNDFLNKPVERDAVFKYVCSLWLRSRIRLKLSSVIRPSAISSYTRPMTRSSVAIRSSSSATLCRIAARSDSSSARQLSLSWSAASCSSARAALAHSRICSRTIL